MKKAPGENAVMRDTKTVGSIAVGAVALALMKKGKGILLPVEENHRYDFVMDDGGKLVKVQCKAGRLRRGCVIFHAASSHYHRRGGCSKSYKGSADMFGVYCRENDEVYMVLVDSAPSGTGTLRITPAKNGQKSGIVWAADFRLA